MASFDDFIVYVDESGDHSLTSIDQQYSICVLAFCLFDKEKYAERITTNVTPLKFKYFSHDQVVLHERAIWKEEEEFSTLRQEETRSEFLQDLSGLIRGVRFRSSRA